MNESIKKQLLQLNEKIGQLEKIDDKSKENAKLQEKINHLESQIQQKNILLKTLVLFSFTKPEFVNEADKWNEILTNFDQMIPHVVPEYQDFERDLVTIIERTTHQLVNLQNNFE